MRSSSGCYNQLGTMRPGRLSEALPIGIAPSSSFRRLRCFLQSGCSQSKLLTGAQNCREKKVAPRYSRHQGRPWNKLQPESGQWFDRQEHKGISSAINATSQPHLLTGQIWHETAKLFQIAHFILGGQLRYKQSGANTLWAYKSSRAKKSAVYTLTSFHALYMAINLEVGGFDIFLYPPKPNSPNGTRKGQIVGWRFDILFR